MTSRCASIYGRRRPSGFWETCADFHNRTIAFQLGDWVITTYAFFVGAAFCVGYTVALWYVAAGGYNPGRYARLHVLITMPIVFIGLRAFSIMTEWRKVRLHPLQTIIRPGYMLHGGICGGALALCSIARANNAPALFHCDSAALALPIGEAIARIGCHVYGCCWGRPTNGAFGIRYVSADARVVHNQPNLWGVKLHPVQLYSSAFALALFGLMLHLIPLKSFDGMLTVAYCMIHPIGRFILERLRQDNRGRFWGEWTHTNLYSALMFMGGVGIFALSPGLHNTLIDVHVSWVPLLARVFRWVVPFGVFFALTYGVHYKRVGSWIPARETERETEQ